ncbi:MAG TPA: sulfotransferase [Pseudomonadales bacterium]|nr:sulfotransferase [Pseudomonadales bacterium]
MRATQTNTSSSEKRPDFLIVGAPKCGTTALAAYLAGHPDIYMAQKEMHFFGADLQFGPQFFRRDSNAYRAEFGKWNGQTRTGEASVWYLYSRQAAAEIKAYSPDARIIILLREPVSMLYSLYHSYLYDGNEHLPTFEEALKAEKDRSQGRSITRQTYFVQGLAYRSVVTFSEQVRRYFDVFGRERVHVIIYDDLAADTIGTYRTALGFLGVSDTVDIPIGPINTNVSVKSPLMKTVLNDPLVRGTAIALRSWLPKPIFSVIQNVGINISEMNKQPAPRRPIDPDLRHSLQREFAPEVERLSELLKRDLTHWSTSGTSASSTFRPVLLSSKQAVV